MTRPLARALPTWMRPLPAVFLLAWGGNHFTPLIHLYETLGHYASWQANLLLGMYVLGLVPGLLIASAISDRRGRRPVLLAGIASSILGSLVLGLGLHQFALLCIGRAMAGIGVGVAMSVGTSWVKELSSAPYDLRASASAGARRPALTLTAGFAVGAAVTGLLAQWGPAPAVIPYAVHGILCLAGIPGLLAAPETRGAGSRAADPWWHGLQLPTVGHRRFTRLVLPAAPWVFGAAGVAYAVMPAVVQDGLGDWTTLYATVLTVLTLGAGALIQNAVPMINNLTHGRASAVGLVLIIIGLLLAVPAAAIGNPVLALAVALVLGCAYGICMVAGLIHVQAIAPHRELAGLTGVYYSLTYTGFLLPTLLAVALPVSSYATSLAVLAVLGIGSLSLVAGGFRRGLA